MAFTPGESSKYSELFIAASSGDLKKLKKLGKELDRGQGLKETIGNVRLSAGLAVFHAAAGTGRTNICNYLIEELKLDPDQKDGRDCTPLSYASAAGHLSTVAYLIDNGADPTALNRQNLTALHIAVKMGNIELIEFLFSKGVDVNAPSESDAGTPLQVATTCCREDVLKVLLDHGANPNVAAGLNPTPLMLAFVKRSLPCATLLIQARADVDNASHSLGSTPLACAAAAGEADFVKCLLESGADPNITDYTGLKPIELAAQNGHNVEVKLLFPVTSPIPACSDRSITGIVKYVNSEEVKLQMKLRAREKHLEATSKGDQALKDNDYASALAHYKEAVLLDHDDANAKSNRSRCMAYLAQGRGSFLHFALSDAEDCIKLRPDWPEAYYRDGVALSLLKDFDKAVEKLLLGLKLDPGNKDLRVAFKKAVEAKMNSSLHV